MTAPAPAEQDYAAFIRWWQAKGYQDGQQVDFSDARDAFASGMRAARDAVPSLIVNVGEVLTEEQAAEFRAALDRAVKDGKPPAAGPEGARELLALARSVTWTWAVIGVAVALPVVLLARTPWGACALAPWAICQAAEWVLGRRLARPPS